MDEDGFRYCPTCGTKVQMPGMRLFGMQATPESSIKVSCTGCGRMVEIAPDEGTWDIVEGELRRLVDELLEGLSEGRIGVHEAATALGRDSRWAALAALLWREPWTREQVITLLTCVASILAAVASVAGLVDPEPVVIIEHQDGTGITKSDVQEIVDEALRAARERPDPPASPGG